MSEKFLLENFVLLTGKSLGILIFPMDWNLNEIYFHYMCFLSILPKSSGINTSDVHYCKWCSELVSIRGSRKITNLVMVVLT